MDTHEVYPNAPLVLVALELRHPPATEPLSMSQQRLLKDLLSGRLPIMRRAQQINFEITAIGAVPPVSTTEEFPRFSNRDGTMAVSMRTSSIVIEASQYDGWDDFRLLALEAFSARMQVAPVDGVERIGLRYIDEIRVPDVPPEWSQWVHDSLLGPSRSESVRLPLSQWQGVGVYGEQPGCSLVLRYGPRQGHAVDPNADIRRVLHSSDGEFFLMDLDSFWTPKQGTPEFEIEAVLRICDDLHHPVRGLFESLITNRLREEVLRDGS